MGKSHPWRQFNPSFLSKYQISEDQQKILDRESKSGTRTDSCHGNIGPTPTLELSDKSKAKK